MRATPPAFATGDLAWVFGGCVLLSTDCTGRVFCFAEGGSVSHLEASCAAGGEGKVVVWSYGAPVSMDKHMFSPQIVDVFESLDGKDNGGVSLIRTLLLRCQPP